MRRDASIDQSRLHCGVMHIHPHSASDAAVPASVRCVEERLAEASVESEVYTDVYRGLARICWTSSQPTGGGRQWVAVIVCVDGLTFAEIEFFSILKRLGPAVPVYVYGSGQSEKRVVQAIDHGAAGRVTDAVLASITAAARDRSRDPTKAAERVSEPEETSSCDEPHRSSGHLHPLGQDGHGSAAADVATDHEASPEDEDALEGPARVPWLRYAGGPTRGAPRHAPPRSPRTDQHQAGEPPEETGDSQPLLTEQELQALLGTEVDDIAAIVPRAPGVNDASEHPEGSTQP